MGTNANVRYRPKFLLKSGQAFKRIIRQEIMQNYIRPYGVTENSGV